MTAQCKQVENLVVAVRIDEGWPRAPSRFGATRHDVELDDLIPFYSQDSPVIWLGERALDEVSIEDPEDVELRCAPGYSNPSDSIAIEFLANAVALERAGNLRDSLAIVYYRIDEMMKFGMIELLEEELSSVPTEEIGTDLLLGLLTATLPVKSQLPSRPALFKATKRLLKSRGHYEPGILDGLK